MFDTHCHLNFKRFNNTLNDVILHAHDAGVTRIVIPGTDIESSKKALEIAEQYDGIYAAVGIHPHHVFELQRRTSAATPVNVRTSSARAALSQIIQLLSHPKVVAVGEMGLDKHVYEKTKYETYDVSDDFLTAQRELLTGQLQLALSHNKSVILHNREATDELLAVLTEEWDNHFSGKTVFHCCEPDRRLLDFAQKQHVFIGVDGDITYNKEKQEFIKQVPLDLLVLETDAPFLLPEPLRSQKAYPNEPKNIPVISSFVAHLLGIGESELEKRTDENAERLFKM